MNEIDKIKKKFESNVLKNIDKENFYKILGFLVKEKCNFIEDIVYNYLDLFNINYDEFIKKYNIINNKYNGNFLEQASEDMNLFEEFYSL